MTVGRNLTTICSEQFTRRKEHAMATKIKVALASLQIPKTSIHTVHAPWRRSS